MREVANISDLQKMTWVRFFHLYEQQSQVVEEQIRALQNSRTNGK